MYTISARQGILGPGVPTVPAASCAPGSVPGPSCSLAAVSQDRIRMRAYEIYLIRRLNGAEGNALSDWLQAERELPSMQTEQPFSPDIEFKARIRGEALVAGAS